MPGTYQIPHRRPILGRHVHHDPQSRRYAFPRTADANYRPPAVLHTRHIPIFDQDDELGTCTAETGLGLMGTSPYWDALCAITQGPPVAAGPYPLNADGVERLYTDITGHDPFPGQWPPEDTGSDGLSMAQALVRAGIVPGYQHTFSLPDALAALAEFPLAVGSLWTNSMFYPDSRTGLVRYYGYPVGGHEWIVDQYDPVNDWVGATNSWGPSFGRNGRFYLTVEDFGRLLADDGDVIVLVPPTAPAPEPSDPDPGDPGVPSPGGDPDVVLAAAMRAWLQARNL